jgi:LCP family protein required for cell wall assembly
MTAQVLSSPAYSRLHPGLTRPLPAAAARPTRGQSAVELTLFAVFGASIILCAIALYSLYSPRHRQVPNRIAAGLQSGRVNVLIIGTSRDGNNTATESLTLLSLQPQSHQAAMMSIPRDLWVHIGRYGSHRLAAAVNIGESSGYPGEGPGLVSDTLEGVIGQPVHAYVRLDAADLQTTIDALGGIDIVAARPLYEYRHQDRFAAGPLHLDGERAVRYAQSHAVLGPQGERFARELRQQQVIAAVVEKISAAPPEVRARLAAARQLPLTSTNLTAPQIDQLCDEVRAAQIGHVTLQPLVTEFEVRSLADAGDAVRTTTGDYGKVQELARNVFAAAQPIVALR